MSIPAFLMEFLLCVTCAFPIRDSPLKPHLSSIRPNPSRSPIPAPNHTMASRARLFLRSLHTTRKSRAQGKYPLSPFIAHNSHCCPLRTFKKRTNQFFHHPHRKHIGPQDVESYYNEPGGRLFGEAIRKPGERRRLFDWEVPYIGTLVIAGLMLGFGLNSRPDTSITTWAREEALARQMAAEAKEGDASE